MSLSEFFEEKLDEIRAFMEFPPMRMMAIQHDPDIKHLLRRILVGMENEEENPHIMVYFDTSFETPEKYFSDLSNELISQNERLRSELADEGIDLPEPPDNSPIQGQRDPLSFITRFAGYVSDFAERLPDSVGSIVVIIDPSNIADTNIFAWAMETLALLTTTDWAKYIVLDSRMKPFIGDLEERCDRATILNFNIAPEEIEKQMKTDLENPSGLSPAERRKYFGMLAGFAFGRKDYEEAARLQTEWLVECKKEGTPQEAANAYYCLGNTRLAQGDFIAAEDCFCISTELCLDNNVSSLLPLIVTNLGVTLHRQDRVSEAIRCFDVARDSFRSQSQLPGEAHALDCLAAMYEAENRPKEAEGAWLEALSLYDGIKSDAFSDVRDAGRLDLVGKLERLYESTGQQHKIAGLKKGGN